MKKSFKIIITIAMVFTMAIGLCSVAFASTVSPSLLPYMADSSGLSAGGFVYWANGNFKGYAGSNSPTDCYAFLYNDSNNQKRLCAVSDSAFTLFANAYNSPSNIYTATAVLDGGYYVADIVITAVAGSAQIWAASSKAEGVAACEMLLNPATVSELKYDLPCGNIAYISVPVDDVTITLSETMPFLSAVVGTSWKEINQMYGIVTSLPTLGGSVDMTNISRIPWERSTTGATNWLGQTNSATYSFTDSAGGYVVIYNPSVYPTDQSGMTFTTASNNSIHLEVSDAISMRVYATSDDGVLLSNAPTVSWYSDTSSDDDFSSWTDSSGGSSPPTYGGDNILPEEQSIKGLLQKLADEIKGIFEIAWKPIQDIIQSVGGFLEKLADLWSWLPTEVSSLLIAGLTVIVAVGVLKSFL